MGVAKTQLNVRVDETTAEAARRQAGRRGMSVNRYIEELVKQDAGEIGKTFVESAADFMKQYESVFTEEFDAETTPERGRDRSARRSTGPEGTR